MDSVLSALHTVPYLIFILTSEIGFKIIPILQVSNQDLKNKTAWSHSTNEHKAKARTEHFWLLCPYPDTGRSKAEDAERKKRFQVQYSRSKPITQLEEARPGPGHCEVGHSDELFWLKRLNSWGGSTEPVRGSVDPWMCGEKGERGQGRGQGLTHQACLLRTSRVWPVLSWLSILQESSRLDVRLTNEIESCHNPRWKPFKIMTLFPSTLQVFGDRR